MEMRQRWMHLCVCVCHAWVPGGVGTGYYGKWFSQTRWQDDTKERTAEKASQQWNWKSQNAAKGSLYIIFRSLRGRESSVSIFLWYLPRKRRQQSKNNNNMRDVNSIAVAVFWQRPSFSGYVSAFNPFSNGEQLGGLRSRWRQCQINMYMEIANDSK